MTFATLHADLSVGGRRGSLVSKVVKNQENKIKNDVRRPGVEPGSTAWKATMLTVTPPTQATFLRHTIPSEYTQLSPAPIAPCKRVDRATVSRPK